MLEIIYRTIGMYVFWCVVIIAGVFTILSLVIGVYVLFWNHYTKQVTSILRGFLNGYFFWDRATIKKAEGYLVAYKPRKCKDRLLVKAFKAGVKARY